MVILLLIHIYRGYHMNEIAKDSPEFEDKAAQMFEERVSDINGWFLESFTEADDGDKEILAKLLIAARGCPSDKVPNYQRLISDAVYSMVIDRCEPLDAEVMEALNNEF